MSKTPRTDAETVSIVRIAGFLMAVHSGAVRADFARTLEMELLARTLDNESLSRRLKLATASAEKHHEGDRAACEREAKLREQIDTLSKALLAKASTHV